MKQEKNILKMYFETGDKPTQIQYENLIDSLRHAYDKIPLEDLNLEGYDEEGERDNSLIVRLGDFVDASNGTKIVINDDDEEITMKGTIALVSTTGDTTAIEMPTGSGQVNLNLPTTSGTLALTSEIPALTDVAYKNIDNNFSSGQSINGVLDIFTDNAIALDINNSTTGGGQIRFQNTSGNYQLGISGGASGEFILYDANANTVPWVVNTSGDHNFGTGAATFGGVFLVKDGSINKLETEDLGLVVKGNSATRITLNSVSGNDSVISFDENGVQKAKIGFDSSDNQFKIIGGSGPFSSNTFTLDSSGNSTQLGDASFGGDVTGDKGNFQHVQVGINNQSNSRNTINVYSTNNGVNPIAYNDAGSEIILRNLSTQNGNFSALSGYNADHLVTSKVVFINEDVTNRHGKMSFMTHDGTTIAERLGIGTTSIDINLNVDATGQDITAANFIGDGSQLTNLPVTAPANVAYTDSNNNFTSIQTFQNEVIIGDDQDLRINFNTSSVWNYYLQADGNNWHIDDGGGTKFIELLFNSGGSTKSIEFETLANFASKVTVNNNLNVTGTGDFGNTVTAPIYVVDSTTGWMVKHDSGNHGLSYNSSTGRTQLQSSGSIALEIQGTTVYSRNLIVDGLSTISSTLAVNGLLSANGGLDVSGNTTFSNSLTVESANPTIVLKETDLTDQNIDLQVNGGFFKIYGVNDARDTFNEWVTVNASSGLFEAKAGAWVTGDFDVVLGDSTATFMGNNDAQLRLTSSNDAWSGIGFNGTSGNIGYIYYNSTGEYFQMTKKANLLQGLDLKVTDADRYVNFRAPNDEERIKFYVGSTGNPPYIDMYDSDGITLKTRINSVGTSTFGGDINASGQTVTASDFIGNWNGKTESDFVRATGNVTETVTGEKTFENTLKLGNTNSYGRLEFYESTTGNFGGLIFRDEVNSNLKISGGASTDKVYITSGLIVGSGHNDTSITLESFNSGISASSKAQMHTYTEADNNAGLIFGLENGTDSSFEAKVRIDNTTGLYVYNDLDVAGTASATDFLGNWNGKTESDFMRATGDVDETITGDKTFSEKTLFSSGLNLSNTWDITSGSGKLYFNSFGTEYLSFGPTGFDIASNVHLGGFIRLKSYTVATLPTGSLNGRMAYVTDASSISYRAVATGGGSSVALVFHDGTNWIYH